MDDDLQKIEAELRQLRPVVPPPGLRQRVSRDLTPSPWRPGIHWLWGLALSAAAVVTLVFLPIAWRDPEPRSDAGAPAKLATAEPGARGNLKPVAVENVLYSAEDEGMVTLEDGTPARRERLSYVDTITWRNPRTKASLTWKVPREEVRVVPILFQ